MADRVIKLEGRGLRGESFGDTARRLGQVGGVPVPANSTDAQVLGALAVAAGVTPEIQALVDASISAGERAEFAAEAAQVLSNYYTTRAAGAAATPTDELFTSDEEGQMAVYRRTADSPNYEWLYWVARRLTVESLEELRSTPSSTHAVMWDGSTWNWVEGDLSEYVTIDTVSGMFAAPDSDPTGESGAWVRQANRFIDPRWFGAVADLYVAEVPASFSASSSTLTLSEELDVDVTGWEVAYRRGNTGTLAHATNAPFAGERRTVVAVDGTDITLSADATITATAAEALDPITGHYEEGGAAVFYKVSTAALQTTLTLAHLLGLEARVPEGSFVTDELDILHNVRFVGAGKGKSKLYFRPCQPFVNGHRASIIVPKNLNKVTQRHNLKDPITGKYIPVRGVYIADMTLIGHGYFQNPLGPNYLNGQYAFHNINCIFVEDWLIERVHSEDAQGDACYLGSRTNPTDATFDDVSSRRVTLRGCTFKRCWRLAHQRGNITDTLIQDCDYIDNNLGIYNAITRLGGSNGTYGYEMIDAEANVGKGFRSVWERCFFTTIYGHVMDLLWEAIDITFRDCHFRNCMRGALVQSPVSTSGGKQLGEGFTLENCIFEATTTDVTHYIDLRHTNAKVIGCKFRGQTNNARAAIQITALGDDAREYVNFGTILSNNFFDIGSSTISIDAGAYDERQIRDGIWQDSNVIKSGLLDLRQGARPRQELTAMGMAGARVPVSWAPSANGGSGPIWATVNTFGLSSNDWTLHCRFWANAASGTETPLLIESSTVVELRVDTPILAGASKALTITLNPGNSGAVAHDIYAHELGNASAAFRNKSRPIDLTLVHTSSGLAVWVDGQYVKTLAVAAAFSSSGLNITCGRGNGGLRLRIYEVSMYNKALGAKAIRDHRAFGPAFADRWGAWGGSTGCVLNCNFTAGIGFQCFDNSSNGQHFYAGGTMAWESGVRKGTTKRRIVGSGASNNRLNSAGASFSAQPAGSVIRRAWAVVESGTPNFTLGTASGGDQIVTSVALTSGYNEFTLVGGSAYASADRTIWIGLSGSATATFGIDYELL
jgi:hypothetical protein